MNIKVAIVEDQHNTLNSLSILLNGSNIIKVVGTFSSGEKAIQEIPNIMPDVVLIDLGLPEISGIEVIMQLKTILPHINILVLTIYDDKDHLFPALKAGATGYLLKDSSPAQIIEAIEEIYNGGAPMSARIARCIIEYFHNTPAKETFKNNLLTKREKEILKGLEEGLTYKKLAEKYSISPHTVRTHIKKIYEKLHVNSRWEAISKAKKKGLLFEIK